jgi:hypothetical protein
MKFYSKYDDVNLFFYIWIVEYFYLSCSNVSLWFKNNPIEFYDR